jgi:hypothetical protein
MSVTKMGLTNVVVVTIATVGRLVEKRTQWMGVPGYDGQPTS